MKRDLSLPLTQGARRTLAAFSTQMLALLTEKSFEQIAVGELCARAQYPRATFYNYFDDKYDLLHYCWLTLAERIGLSDYHHAPENEMLSLYFDRIWTFTRENDEKIERVLARNPESGYMLSSFRTFLGSQMRKIFEDCPDAAEKGLPAVLLADHYSNTLFLVWQWATLEEPNCSKEQAALYLRKLLSIP